MADGLNAEGLHTLQAQPQQHRDEIQPDDDADRCRQIQPRQPGETGFSAKDADRLAKQNGLNSSRKGQGKKQRKGDQKTPTVPSEISTQTTDTAPIR